MKPPTESPETRRQLAGPRFVALVLALSIAGALGASAAGAEETATGIDTRQAAACFREIRELSKADGGRLWGVEIYGPMLFVNPQTRAAAANRADAERHLAKAGDIFTGTLSPDAMIANTAVEWAGVRWTMLLWPLPKDKTDRLVLMAHECWHRIQNSLGLPMSDQASSHLDTLDGRYWLQLEWRALGVALSAAGAPRRQHVADALLFRAHRRGLFADAAARERALEMNEGLAEYTGIRAAIPDDAAACRYAGAEIERASRKDAFARSFAYASGPAYGLLLDAACPTWRASLGFSSDLGDLLRNFLGLLTPADDPGRVAQRAAVYDADGSLRQAEVAREEKRLQRLATYKRQFVDGPILDIPLQSASYSFDPNQVFPFENRGSVYGVLSIRDQWGVLEAEKGAFVSADFTRLVLPAPGEPAVSPLAGEGWKLSLAKGWKIVPGARPGDFTVAHER